MADSLHVELVAADRTVWSGEATMVIARTVEGDVGILRNHAPLLSLLTDANVEITGEDGEVVLAVADGGFISVANNRVSILSERAILADDIQIAEVRAELERPRPWSARTTTPSSGSAGPRPGSARWRRLPDPIGLASLRVRGAGCRSGNGWSTLPASCCCSPWPTASHSSYADDCWHATAAPSS